MVVVGRLWVTTQSSALGSSQLAAGRLARATQHWYGGIAAF
eukprot:SAG25_NODE_11387_length_305_cov_1.233010_1_plen_40_part_01